MAYVMRIFRLFHHYKKHQSWARDNCLALRQRVNMLDRQ